MAEPTIDKVKEELTCAVCHELFTTPKTLPCLHTFCETCLIQSEEMRRKTRGRNDSQGKVECPMCYGISEHHGGVKNITTNFTFTNLVEHVNIHRKVAADQNLRCGKCKEDVDAPAMAFCYDCGAALCEFCHKMHQRNRELSSHTILTLEKIKNHEASAADLPKVKRVHTCSIHGKEQELKLYCYTCSEVICRDCTVTKSEHRDHTYEFISKVIEDEKEDLKRHLEPLQNVLNTVKKCSVEVKTHMHKLEELKNSREEQIHTAVNSAVHCLKERQRVLLGESSEIYEYKKKNLALQLESIEEAQSSITSALDFASTTMEKGTDVELLMYKAGMITRSITLQEAHKRVFDSFEITEEDHTNFVHNPEPFKQFGMLWEAPCASKSTVEGPGLSSPMQGEETEFTVQARNSSGQQLLHGGGLCSIEISSSPVILKEPHVIKPTVTDNSNGTYTVSYTPRYPGTNSIAVKFGDDTVKGCPYEICVVRNYVRPLPEPSIFTIPKASPWGLAMISDTELAITASDCLVHIYSIDGEEKGVVQSSFIRPYGIATDHDGYLWLTDREAHTIQKFRRESNGEFVKLFQFGSRGVNAGQFSHPRGIAVNPDTGHIYISDMKNNRIQIYKPETTNNPEPQYLGQFGGPGKTPGCFNLPAGLCFNRKGELIVCDDHNCRLQVFDPEGRFLYDLGTNKAHKGLLCSPIGIATDSLGRYIITEFGSHCITFLSPEGEILNCVRTIGKGYGQFVHPRGITVDSSGYVYVADNENMRVARF